MSKISDNNIDQALSQLSNNYFLRYEGIPDMVVYSGWLKDLKDDLRQYSLEGYVFLSSFMKMGEYLEGDTEYEIAKRKLIKELSDNYIVAKYIYNLGY